MAKFIQKAITDHSHPVIRAAKRKGISTHDEAEEESHSPNKRKRARGILALRFERGGDLHK